MVQDRGLTHRLSFSAVTLAVETVRRRTSAIEETWKGHYYKKLRLVVHCEGKVLCDIPRETGDLSEQMRSVSVESSQLSPDGQFPVHIH